MRSTKILFLAAVMILSQSALADENRPGGNSPFAGLQAQIEALEARTDALEANATNASVEGRNYCFVLNMTIMRGRSNFGTEELQTNVIRRSATFSGGLFTGNLLSNTLNNQTDDGVVTAGSGTPIDPVTATYTQTGTKVDMIFGNGVIANWYVSKDGSTVHGSAIEQSAFGPGGVLTVGILRNWTLVETDAPENCDQENQ